MFQFEKPTTTVYSTISMLGFNLSILTN